MPDQTADVVKFIWDRHPELDPEDIMKCVVAMGDWVAAEMEKEHLWRPRLMSANSSGPQATT